ncbi:MAG: hypothetical protein ACOX3P_03945 [Saccharofermentanales bacterium]|jgi:hypothetical protein|nr:hypothetical protein [Bacillota bacterium]
MASILIQKVEPASDTGVKTGQAYSDILPPSHYEWGKEDISDPKAGRTSSMAMKKLLRGKARTLNLAWNGKSYAEIAAVLQAFDHEYAWITYIDALTGVASSKLFYMSGMKATSFTATKGGIWEVATVNCIQAIPDPP